MKQNKSTGRKGIWVFILCAVLAVCAFTYIYMRKVNQMEQDRAVMEEKHHAEISRLESDKQALDRQIYHMTHPENGVAEHGRLHVAGTGLQNEKGETVVLRGLSSHGLAWYPQYCNYGAMKTLKSSGANAFRVAMYVEGYNCYLEQEELNTGILCAAIENVLEADMYAIVDWHVLKDRNPMYNVEAAKAFFERIARTYGDEPGILYEICNEPNGYTSFEDIQQYARQIIPVIRQYAPNAVILVGTPNFSSSPDAAENHDLEFDNICFTFHYYAQHMKLGDAVSRLNTCIQSGIPVMVTEWGYNGEHLEGENWNDTVAFLDFLDENQISWINWSLCNKDESYSAIRPDVDTLSHWEEQELTEIGSYVLDRLKRTVDQTPS